MNETNMSKPELAYRKIKELLRKNEIVPGQKLQLADFAEKLNVSITPLREALGRISQEGYVVQLPNKGFYVNTISIKEADEIFDVRYALELASIEKVVDFINEEDLNELRVNLKIYKNLIKNPPTRSRFVLDHQFHLRMVKISRNNTMVKLLSQILEKLILKRKMEGLSQERGTSAFNEHKALISFLEKRDKKGAAEALKIHLENAKEDFIQSLKRLDNPIDDGFPLINEAYYIP